jgi:hypothetical protein
MATKSSKSKRTAPRKPVATGAPPLKVCTRFSAPIHGVEGRVHINAMALFTNIEFLAPQKTITTFLDTSAAYFGRDEPRLITALISYRDAAQKKYATTVHHDLNIYADIGYIRRVRDER